MPHTSKSGPRSPMSTRTRRTLKLGAVALSAGVLAFASINAASAADGLGEKLNINLVASNAIQVVGYAQPYACDTSTPVVEASVQVTNLDENSDHGVHLIVITNTIDETTLLAAGTNDPENPSSATLTGTDAMSLDYETDLFLLVDFEDGKQQTWLGSVVCPTVDPTPDPTPTTEPTTDPTPDPTPTTTPTPDPTPTVDPTPDPTPTTTPTTPPSTGGGGTTNPPSTGNPPSAGGGSGTDNDDTTKSSGRKGGATDGQDGVFESGKVNLTLPDESADPASESSAVEASNSQAPQPVVPMWLVWAFGGFAVVLLVLWSGSSLYERRLKKGSTVTK